MASLTDPARELSEIAKRLEISDSQPGARFLAEQFGVESWSTDFMRIITCIMERADLVTDILRNSDLDQDHKDNALEHVWLFKTGFTGPALGNHWNSGGHGLVIMKNHGAPIQFLSQTVRPVIKYPKLSEEEIAELIEAIDQYLAALANSDEGPDFVRQAISDGLGMFRFRLDKLSWMGSGYALTAFREVIEIYRLSDSQFTTSSNPDAGAFLSGFLDILHLFKSKVDNAKGWTDSAGSVWNAYGLASRFTTPLLLAGHFPALS